MTISSKKPAKYPRYDPDHDGNPFHWVLQTSALIRKNNINGQAPKYPSPLRPYMKIKGFGG